MLNPILLTAICAVVSFFIGAIPFGLILGRVFNHTDIRKAGSGNIGTTNALRVAGPKVAALTLLLDCLKGAICVLIARPLIASVGYGFPVSIMAPGAAGDWMLGVICLAAVWGHIFSPYLNFHGGKGIVEADPDEETLAAYTAKAEAFAAEKAALEAFRGKPSVTADGIKKIIACNIGNPDDVPNALDHDAEAIGLFRSEFLFMDSAELPSE